MKTRNSYTTPKETTLHLEMTFSEHEREALMRAEEILLNTHIDVDAFLYEERIAIVELVEHIGRALR